ncbi:MAG: PEGA domain-containing protein [Pseudomonadota bacterium]|nr:PEGA domain-containing protein [Pseudomonadota bacterium]
MNRVLTIYQQGEVYEFNDGDLPLTIGSGAGVHIHLPAGRAVEAHIADSRDHLFLQPADDTSGVYHNDTLVSSSVWIKSGDYIRIADITLHFHVSGDRVEIRISADQENVLTPPPGPSSASPANHATEAGKRQKKLPRAAVPSSRPPGDKKLRYLAGGILLLLIAAAAFVLSARSIEVSVTPAPEKISISGFPPAFKFGSRYLALKGEYTVRAARPGYQELAATITVKENGRNQFNLTLKKLPGSVDIISKPLAGAEVFIDDLLMGTTPLNNLEIPAGEHQLRLVKERYLTIEQIIQVEGLGRQQHFDFMLSPAWAEVTLTSDPAGARVFAGETDLGRTPVTIELAGGEHLLTLHKNKFSPAEISLKLTAGGSYTPRVVTLSPAPATVVVKSIPTGAAVSVDGDFKGATPVSISLSSREQHEISLSLSGHRGKKSLLTFAPGTSRELSFTLPPEHGIIFLTTEPANAELLIDGQVYGPATGRLRLTATRHTLTVRARGYETARRTVTPSKAHSLQLNIRLQPVAALSEPKTANKKKKIAAAGHEMIRLEPAVFMMGASRREPGRRANEQLRQVKITRPFYLATREVTNDQFRRFKPGHRSGQVDGHTLDGGSRPVVMVSWEEAAGYCNWLSKQEGLDPCYRQENSTMVTVNPVTNGYRLPFEAEWAYAARVVDGNRPARYPWKGSFPPQTVSGNYGDEAARSLLTMVIRGYNDGHPVTAPVASFSANNNGFFDMGGNVSEWCHDFYAPSSLSGTDGREIDPTGPATGTHHVVRGSSWRDNTITELRLSYRSYSRNPKNDLGFRVARYAR